MQFPRVRTNNVEQTSTASAKHRHVGLRAGYLSMRTAGGASDRR